MQPYKNLSGACGVVAYEIAAESITVRFNSGTVYRYDHHRPGAAHVAEMQRLAQAGHGLGSYISRHVGKNFAARLV